MFSALPTFGRSQTTSAVRNLCVGLFVTAFLFRCVGVLTDQPIGFYALTPCRWDALAAGGFIAALVQQQGIDNLRRLQPYALAVLGVGSATLASFFFAMKGLWPNPLDLTVGLSIIGATFAAAILLVLQGGAMTRLVDRRMLRFFGKYSYGIYVIHGLIGAALALWIPTTLWFSYFPSSLFLLGIFSLAAVKILVCTLLAMLSWHLYEKRFLGLKEHFKYASPATPGLGRAAAS
jgi:peptidoglycan/LPS O-acetylase OafA/YrhL